MAETEPQIAHSALVFGLSKRWMFIMRTLSEIGNLFQPLEEVIVKEFLPAILGFPFSDDERRIFSLPARSGGLGIFNPCDIAEKEYNYSTTATAPLVEDIINQRKTYSADVSDKIKDAKKKIQRDKTTDSSAMFEEIKQKLSDSAAKNLELQSHKGASSWLTCLPLAEHDFVVNKQEFKDAMSLRYGKPINGMPRYCSCGEANNLNHALICKRGGYVSIRHNQIRDLESSMLSEVCKDVKTEPPLIPLTNERFPPSTNTSESARLDISARGVWNAMDKSFFDIRVFHPGSTSNSTMTPPQMYRKHEEEKKRTYNKRIIDVEKSTFTPLVFSTTGGMGKEAESFHKRLATLISNKRNILYSEAMSYIRRRLRFCLLKATLMALRGFRKPSHSTVGISPNTDINLIPSPV